MDIAWPQTGFALAVDYDAATGDFKGLTVPIEAGPAVVTDTTYLVAPQVASAQRAREQAVTETSTTFAEPKTNAPSMSTATQPAATPQSSSGDDSVVERARYEGRYEVDATAPEAIADKLREVIEEVVRHIVSAPGAENVSIVLEVSAENSDGFSEAVARTVRENSRVLGFDKSDFEDVSW